MHLSGKVNPLLFSLWLIFVAIIWGGIVFGRFQFDDYPNILNDPATAMGPLLWERLVHGIRPLTRLSYAIDFALWGESASGWFATSLLIHLITTLGVWRLARYVVTNEMGAVLAALLFALQPAHGAAIAYVSGRSSALMTLFLVWAFVFHERSTRYPEYRKSMIAIAFVLFFAACGAKEVALVFPLLLLLWEWFKPNSTYGLRPGLRSVAPYFAASLLLAGYLLTITRYRELLAYSTELRGPIDSLLQNLTALPLTASLLLRPWALAVEHAPPLVNSVTTVLGAATILAWAAIAIIKVGARRMLAIGLLWPLIALLPTHSLIAKIDPISESPLYLAWVGPAIAFGAAAGRWLSTFHGSLMRYYCVLCSVAVVSVFCAWRVAVWSNPIRLWQEAVRNVPESNRAWNNLGMAHLTQGNIALARASFREAMHLAPANSRSQFNLELTELFDPANNLKDEK